MEKDYLKLKEFWDQNFKISEEDKAQLTNSEVKEDDYKSLVPSTKQLEALESFKGCSNFLDYGCGDGWASFVVNKTCVKNVLGVDVSKNAIELAKLYSKAFKCDDIKFAIIDDDWLVSQKDESFDGIFSSNVVDVVPEDIALSIIKELARILKKGSKAVFSFNFYMPLDSLREGMKAKRSEVYVGGILRLLSKTDEEWTKIFKQYFKVIKLEYFAWPGEKKETRRLFFLEK